MVSTLISNSFTNITKGLISLVHTYKTHDFLPAYEAPTLGCEDPFYIGYVKCREKSEKKPPPD